MYPLKKIEAHKIVINLAFLTSISVFLVQILMQIKTSENISVSILVYLHFPFNTLL